MTKSKYRDICHSLIYIAGVMYTASTNKKTREEDKEEYCEINPIWLDDVSKRLIALGEEVEALEEDV